MSHDTSDTETGAQTRVETIVPQDTSTGVFDLKFGLTFGELALVALPLVVEAWLYIQFLQPGEWVSGEVMFFAWLSSGVGAAYLVYRTPDHISPRELVARNIGSAVAQVRMPLLGEDARAVPSVVDVHPWRNAVERTDGAQVALVHVDTVNLSQASQGEEEEAAAELAGRIDTKLSKTGTPAKVHVRRRYAADVSRQVRGLRDLAGDPSRGQVGFAADHATAAVRKAVDEGVMDLDVFVATWVRPDEVAADAETTRLDRFASSRRVAPSPGLREEQLTELDRRVQNVRAAARPAEGNTVALSADGIVQVLREYWLDVENDAKLSETTHDGAPVPPNEHRVSGGDDETDERTDADETAAKAVPDGGSADAPPGGEGGKTDLLGRLRGLTSSSAQATAFAPANITARRTSVDVAEHHTSTFWVTGWPKYPRPGFLRPVLEATGVEVDISLFVGRADREDKMDELEARIDAAGTEGASDAESGENASAADAAQLEADLAQLRNHMRDARVDASEVSMYVTLRARDRETLSESRMTFRDRATEAGLSVEIATGASRQMAGLVSTSPVGPDRLFHAMRGYLDRLADGGGLVSKLLGVRTGTRTRMDMPPGALGAMLPFDGGYRQDHDGVLYGLATTVEGNARGMLQVARDRLTAPHRFFVGRSGSGKTFRETVNLVEELVRNPGRQTVIIDIARNFDGVVKLFDGEKVVLGETTVNPFTVSEGADLDGQIRVLTNMFHIYLRHNTEGDSADALRPVLADAVRATYRRVGIDEGTDAGKPSPTMHDFHDTLEHMHDKPAKYTTRSTDTETDERKDHTGTLLSRLTPFTEDGTYSHLVADPDDPDGAADLDARVVLYDMSKYQNAEGAEKGMLTMFVLSQAFDVAASSADEYVTVVVDEAHDMFHDANQAGRVESSVRAGRNAGLCFDFLSQAGEDFDEETARVIAGQSDVSVWGDLGELAGDVPRRFGWNRKQAGVINGDLETADGAGSDYSEAMVNVDGDKYRTEFHVGPVAKAVAEYREADHGPFVPYLEDAIEEAADVEAEWNARIDEVAP